MALDLGNIPFPIGAGESLARAIHLRRTDAGVVCEGNNESLIFDDKVQHTGEKVRLCRGMSQSFRPDPACCEKPSDSARIIRQEGKRLDGECAGCLIPIPGVSLDAFRH